MSLVLRAAAGVMISVAEQRAVREDTLDYRYWRNQGWFEPSCTFCIAHSSSAVELALARFVDRTITPFVAG